MAMSGWDWVATYAALVSTGALALEVRRWFESGVKLRASVMENAMMLNDPFVRDDKRFLSVRISNYGDRPTTVENFGLLEYAGYFWWWKYWRNRPTKAAIVTNPVLPGRPANLPAKLEVGEFWSGFVDWPEVEKWSTEAKGKLWVAVYCSHSSKGFRIRIKNVKTSQERREPASD